MGGAVEEEEKEEEPISDFLLLESFNACLNE
jgi:hypothetical protein